MSDFIESAKSFMNSAVSRTSWEAQKQMRLRNKQGELDKLVDQRHQLMDELGQVAMSLYQQGALTDTQLSRLCASIFELDHDLRNREQQVQEIKNEAYIPDQSSTPVMNYAPPTSSAVPPTGTPPHQPASGAPYTVSSQPTPGGAAYTTNASTQGPPLCPQCHHPLRPNAIYCRDCGAKVS